MKVLVTILTSSDLPLLDVVFNSVKRQIIPPEMTAVTFHPVIIVNTKNPHYADEVRAHMREEHKFEDIVETESNGRPGKGHNSVFKYFATHPEYDWLFPMDGDDLVYPTAFWQLATLLQANAEKKRPDGAPPVFDVLLYLGLDRIAWFGEPGTVLLTRGTFLRTAFEEENHLKSSETIDSPFSPKLGMHQLQVPVRICVLNRKATEVKAPRIEWDETGPALVDYPPFLGVFEQFLKGSLRVVGTANRYLYLYNLLNTKNVTAQFSEQVRPNEAARNKATEDFRKVIKPYKRAKENWERVRDIPFIRTDDDVKYLKNIPFKVDFLQNTLVKHYMQMHLKEMELHYNASKWQAFIDASQLLFERYQELIAPQLLTLVRLNLGVSFFHLYNFDDAIRQWQMALETSTDEQQKTTIRNNIEACQRAKQVTQTGEKVPSAA